MPFSCPILSHIPQSHQTACHFGNGPEDFRDEAQAALSLSVLHCEAQISVDSVNHSVLLDSYAALVTFHLVLSHTHFFLIVCYKHLEDTEMPHIF